MENKKKELRLWLKASFSIKSFKTSDRVVQFHSSFISAKCKLTLWLFFVSLKTTAMLTMSSKGTYRGNLP